MDAIWTLWRRAKSVAARRIHHPRQQNPWGNKMAAKMDICQKKKKKMHSTDFKLMTQIKGQTLNTLL
jgi:hypothetical protein